MKEEEEEKGERGPCICVNVNKGETTKAMYIHDLMRLMSRAVFIPFSFQFV